MAKYGMPVFGTVEEENPVVKTTHGLVMGKNRDGLAIFSGIPYGGNCDGENRFLPPKPANDWEGVRDCTQNGIYAIQYGTSVSSSADFGTYFSGGEPELFGTEEEKQGENCLVLNVVTPGIDKKKRPVLVYLHGGGFATGSGSQVVGSDKLAREEDIVLVGVNHRLHVFGYLYLGAFDQKYEQSGMAGMLDLVLALEWVRDNIISFGGDPACVTIMGESGGGVKVSTLMAMQNAKGLFRRAIIISGALGYGILPQEKGTQTAKKLLEKLGLKENKWKKLLDLPANLLLEAADSIGMIEFFPVADEITFHYQGEDFTLTDTSRDIELIVGSTEDELGSVLPVNEMNITWENLSEKLLSIDSGFEYKGAVNEKNVDEIVDFFRRTDKKNNSPAHLFLKIKSLSSPLGIGAFFQAEAKVRQKGAAVYHYLTAYDYPFVGRPGDCYAWHGGDLPLMLRTVYFKQCEAQSKLMAHSWAAFIRTGNPSTEELEWPAFTLEGKEVMVFDDINRIERDPLGKYRKAIFKNADKSAD